MSARDQTPTAPAAMARGATQPGPTALESALRFLGRRMTLRPMLLGLGVLVIAVIWTAAMSMVDEQRRFWVESRFQKQTAWAEATTRQQLALAHEPRAINIAAIAANEAPRSMALAERSERDLTAMLGHNFEQRLVSTGEIVIRAATFLDLSMQPLATLAADGYAGGGAEPFFAALATREGLDQRRIASTYWRTPVGETVHIVVHPVGGFRLRGYLAVTTDPATSLSGLSKFLQTGVVVEDLAGNVVLDERLAEDGINAPRPVLETLVRAPDGLPLYKIMVQTDDQTHRDAMAALLQRNYVYLAAASLGALAIGALILQATVFRQVAGISNALRRIVAGDTGVRPPEGGADEIGRMSADLLQVARYVEDMARLKAEAIERNRRLASEVAEREKAQARLSYVAEHDDLTGLANRARFRFAAQQRLDRAREAGEPAALGLLNLAWFKQVNDDLGHKLGDELLRQVAERLRQTVRGDDQLARLDGDEFALLAPGLSDSDDVRALMARVAAAISTPYDVSGKSVRVGANIGVAFTAEAGHDLDLLTHQADIALMNSKKGPNPAGFLVFDPKMQAERRDRRALERELRRATEERAFFLRYQPQFDISDGALSLIGVEALIRWQHPTLGFVPPDRFIRVAEETGLIGEIGAWVLRRACADMTALPLPLHVAVNISPLQMTGLDFARSVDEVLRGFEFPSTRLEIEITEGALLHNTDAVQASLGGLREIGAVIAMDDFGTGYSSFGYLQKFPFDKIKIDRSFVSGEPAGDDLSPIVRAIVELGRSLGMRVNAEGVENDQQLMALRALGCDEAQGYLLGKPLAIEEIRLLCEAEASKRAATTLDLAAAPPDETTPSPAIRA